MPRLHNPESGTVDDFTEGQARVRRRKGWLDVEPEASTNQTRAELDEMARDLGLDPDQYRTKADVADAIAEAR